jgi:WbqC-like protein family
MTKTVAILQSNYVPWRGYFDLMSRCDVFIIGDVVQYTRRDWRNRNIIKTPSGPLWLTIPVKESPRSTTAIDEVRVARPRWASDHIRTLTHTYSKARAYRRVSPWLFELLETTAQEEELLSRINERILRAVAKRLGITTRIVQSSDVIARDSLTAIDKNARTLALCQEVGATCYLSGPAAKVYLDVADLNAHGIDVAWMTYDGYRDYPQLWGDFLPQVSIVDLLLNTGDEAAGYLVQASAAKEETAAARRANDRGRRAQRADLASAASQK